MVEQYLSGKDKLLGFFVGQSMKKSKGKANQITQEPNGTESYGIWQINSIHIPKLIKAGILHLPEGGEAVEVFDEIDKTKWDALIAQLFDPE